MEAPKIEKVENKVEEKLNAVMGSLGIEKVAPVAEAKKEVKSAAVEAKKPEAPSSQMPIGLSAIDAKIWKLEH